MSRQHILIILFPWKIFLLLLLYNGKRVAVTSESTPVRIPPCHFCSGYFKEVTQLRFWLWWKCPGFSPLSAEGKNLWSFYPGALTVANVNKIIMAKL